MAIHLITVVGGKTQPLGQMLSHYRDLGVTEFHVHVHLQDSHDPVLDEIESIVRGFGIQVESARTGRLYEVQEKAWESRSAFPDDWYIVVDIDEFQVYPDSLEDILRDCDLRGYDHIKGCFLDRVSPDGLLRPFNASLPISAQYSFGAFLSYPILKADPRKVAAAKGRVRMENNGHHSAGSEMGCPIDKLFIPVHHFKWVDGLIESLRRRIATVKQTSTSTHWQESQRFIDYYEANGRILLEDPQLLASSCIPAYQHWHLVRKLFWDQGFR